MSRGRVLLAAPRSFCAGVDRAIEIVERLLEQYGPPVYVRHQIVHNEHVADAQPAERAGEPERDEAPLRDAVRHADADADRVEAEPPGDPLLGARRAGECQPVSVHARLRTVSFRLLDASYAADGSKPQWMPQCSHRGSFPGPYASHSIPSSSAS